MDLQSATISKVHHGADHLNDAKECNIKVKLTTLSTDHEHAHHNMVATMILLSFPYMHLLTF